MTWEYLGRYDRDHAERVAEDARSEDADDVMVRERPLGTWAVYARWEPQALNPEGTDDQ